MKLLLSLMALALAVNAQCPPSDLNWSCCTSNNPCCDDGGDCDSDADCVGSGTCTHDVGFLYGVSTSMDVCSNTGCQDGVPTGCQPGLSDWGCCSSSTPCRAGQGDCDSDSDCLGTLRCDHDNGANYEYLGQSGSSVMDVCEDEDTLTIWVGNLYDDVQSTTWKEHGCVTLSEPFIGGHCAATGFHDQGWGNSKGYIRMNLKSAGHSLATWDCFGVAPHTNGGPVFDQLKGYEDIVQMSGAGMEVCAESHNGGGGGHSLTVSGLQILLDLVGSPGVINAGNVHDNSHANWEEKASIVLRGTVTSVDCTASGFHDQGWGYQKSQVRVALYDEWGGTKTVADCFGIAPHYDAGARSTTFANHPLTWRAERGDKLAVETYVGGGGGHQIYVDNLVAYANYGQLQTGTLTVSAGNVHDASHANWETKAGDTLMTRIRTLSCTCSAFYDQGWGYQKSQVRVQLVDPIGTELETEDCFGIAPHYNEGAKSNQWDNDLIIWHAQDGDVLNIQTYVGGGGGHQIFVNDLTVTATYGNPSDFCHTESDLPGMGALCPSYPAGGFCLGATRADCALTCCLDDFLFARLG